MAKSPRKPKSSSAPMPPRLTAGLYPKNPGGAISLKPGLLTKINPTEHYASSLSQQKRIPIHALRRFSQTIPVRAAINKIASGVSRMPWYVEPPEDQSEDEAALDFAKKIQDALKRPNAEQINTYTKFVSSIVTELLVLNVAAVERQPQVRKDTQPFWLWPVDSSIIKLNPDWSADREGLLPRYFDTSDEADWVPLMNKDLFLIQRYTNTWDLNPPSPLEVAFVMVASWLGLSDFQQTTTSKASQEYLLDIGEVTRAELEAFRTFWKADVQGKGETPILGGKGKVNVVKLGAANDSGLYMAYCEYLLKIIALAFSLSWRDMNITEADNRATAGIAADASFQDATLPIALILMEHLQLEVIDYYCPGYTLKYTDTEPRNESEEANNANMLYAGNIITKNEARKRTGEELLDPELGDRFIDGSPDDVEVLRREEEAAAEQAALEEEQAGYDSAAQEMYSQSEPPPEPPPPPPSPIDANSNPLFTLSPVQSAAKESRIDDRVKEARKIVESSVNLLEQLCLFPS